jgi:hypothetical protein
MDPLDEMIANRKNPAATTMDRLSLQSSNRRCLPHLQAKLVQDAGTALSHHTNHPEFLSLTAAPHLYRDRAVPVAYSILHPILDSPNFWEEVLEVLARLTKPQPPWQLIRLATRSEERFSFAGHAPRDIQTQTLQGAKYLPPRETGHCTSIQC